MKKELIPNYLTYARIIGILPVCWLMSIDQSWAGWCAFVLYSLLAITDWLDGYLARLWNVKSEVGRFLDPIADKLLITAVLVMLVANGAITGIALLCPILILIREIFISGLREYMGPKNVVVHVTMVAKLKTTAQLIACAILILVPAFGFFADIIGHAILVMATILTVGSGWQYWQVCAQHFKDVA